MDWNNIEQLIDKYYEGETSVQEEDLLKQALLREDSPQHLQTEAELMGFFVKEKQLATTQLNYQFKQEKPKSKLVQLIRNYSGIAAAIAVLGVVFFNQPTRCDNNEPVLAIIDNKMICDEEIARQEAEKALALVAKQLNQGTSKLDYIETLNTPNQILNK